MQFTLWRGDTLIARAELASKHDPQLFAGFIEYTPALEALGPVIQQVAERDGRTVVVQHALERAATRATSEGQSLDASAGWSPLYADDSVAPAPDVPLEAALNLHDTESNIVPAEFIWVVEPVPVPWPDLEAEVPPEALEVFRRWRLMVRLTATLEETR